LILKAGCDPNSERIDEPLKYPVFYVIKDNDSVKLNLLIEYGATVSLKNSFGQSPLQYICEEKQVPDNPSLVTGLLKGGVKVQQENSGLLQSAIKNKKYKVIEVL